MIEKKLIILRRTASQILAAALKELEPSLRLVGGGENSLGFFCDFSFADAFSNAMLARVEERMREICSKKMKICHIEMVPKVALEFLKSQKMQRNFLKGNANQLVSFFSMGDFIDLCEGPFLFSSDELQYWKLVGIEKRKKDIFRIYGIASFSQSELKKQLRLIKDYQKSNHIFLGQQMGLFECFYRDKGDFLWHPRGMVLKELIKEFWKKRLSREKFYFIETGPVQSLEEKRKAHIAFFQKKKISRLFDLFPISALPIKDIFEESIFSCSHGTMGVEYLFCSPCELEEICISSLQFIEEILNIFGFVYYIKLDTKQGNKKLKSAIIQYAQAKVVVEKVEVLIGIYIQDGVGRYWPGPYITIRKEEGVCFIERSSLGIIEKWIALLLEKYQGDLPFWLMPEQIWIGAKNRKIVQRLYNTCEEIGIRPRSVMNFENRWNMVKEAKKQKIPFIVWLKEQQKKYDLHVSEDKRCKVTQEQLMEILTKAKTEPEKKEVEN